MSFNPSLLLCKLGWYLKFVSLTDLYIACDVSNVILRRNKDKFSSLKNVEFKFLDLSKDYLPKGEVCFVRQVLQHLSNDAIDAFVKNLNSNRLYKYVTLTEELPNIDNFKVNLDKFSGKASRASIDSGVVLHKAAFDLGFLNITDLLEVYQDEYENIIKKTIYEF